MQRLSAELNEFWQSIYQHNYYSTQDIEHFYYLIKLFARKKKYVKQNINSD